MTESNPSKAGQIARSIKRHFLNYIFIALFGSLTLITAAAATKALWVKSPLEKAESYIAANEYNDLIERIDKSARWEHMFPALKIRREQFSVICYARTDQLPKAMGIADAMASMPNDRFSIMDYLSNFLPPNPEMNTVDKFAHIIKQLEAPPVAALNLIFDKQNTKLSIDKWAGYNALANELKSAGDINSLGRLLATATTYHPDSVFTKDLARYMEEAQRLASQGKKIPPPTTRRPAPDADAPFGWAVVRSNTANVYDRNGTFVQQVTMGTLIEIDEIRDSKSGRIARGTLYARNTKTPDLVTLVQDLNLKRGMIFELSENELDHLMKRAELTFQIQEAEEAQRSRQAARNPHFAEFTQARKEYQEFWAKASDLTEKHKNSTGGTRHQYAEELRMLTGKDVALANKLKDLKTRHDEWAKANESSQNIDSPQLTALRQQLQQVESQLVQLNLL